MEEAKLIVRVTDCSKKEFYLNSLTSLILVDNWGNEHTVVYSFSDESVGELYGNVGESELLEKRLLNFIRNNVTFEWGNNGFKGDERDECIHKL